MTNKVWAMYDGPNCPSYITRGKWYEVEKYVNDWVFRFVNGFDHISICKWHGCNHLNGDDWNRHDGPTPPDAKPTPPDAGRWTTHDGTAKRPKGVGKRDVVELYKAKLTPVEGV